MEGAMLSKSLIQFSVDGWGCVPSLRPKYGGGKEDNGDLLQKVLSMTCCFQTVSLLMDKDKRLMEAS